MGRCTGIGYAVKKTCTFLMPATISLMSRLLHLGTIVMFAVRAKISAVNGQQPPPYRIAWPYVVVNEGHWACGATLFSIYGTVGYTKDLLEFFFDQTTENLRRGHMRAFFKTEVG